jgi:plasmid stability protein
MPAIQIRDVPPEVLSALNRRAARHERSLEGELRYILAGLAQEEPPPPPLPPLHLKLSQASPPTTWSREEIYGDDGR